MSKFQTGLYIFFGAVAILSVLMFAGFIGGGKDPGGPGASSELVIWGTLPAKDVQDVFNEFSRNRDDLDVSYVEKLPDGFELELLRAKANGIPPDLVLFPHNLYIKLRSQFFVIPEEAFSEREFRELYVDGADILVESSGIPALPVLLDPMVMYWNKDSFNNERVTIPPESWSNLLSLTRVLTKKDERGRILKSAVALGDWRNILHFKDILSLLFLQTGDRIIVKDVNGNPNVVFGTERTLQGVNAAESALKYFIGFTDSAKPQYSWNGSFGNSLDVFAGGDVAIYFGHASDLKVLRKKNPHLNFGVAPVPQLEANTVLRNFAHLYSIGVVKDSKNLNKALDALYALTITENSNQNALVLASGMAPAKRILLAIPQDDPILDVFYKEAIISQTWLDVKPDETDAIFMDLVESLVSKSKSIVDGISGTRLRLINVVK